MTSTITPQAWMGSALCTQTDPEVFFPSSYDIETRRNAINICHNCHVLTTCRAWGDRTEADTFAIFGILAAETPHERRDRRKTTK